MNSNLGPMFHGSAHPFTVGETVEPRGTFGAAYATEDPEEAKAYAEGATSEFGTRHRAVWRVEPIEEGEPEKAGNYFISKKGFRIVGRHE